MRGKSNHERSFQIISIRGLEEPIFSHLGVATASSCFTARICWTSTRRRPTTGLTRTSRSRPTQTRRGRRRTSTGTNWRGSCEYFLKIYFCHKTIVFTFKYQLWRLLVYLGTSLFGNGGILRLFLFVPRFKSQCIKWLDV